MTDQIEPDMEKNRRNFLTYGGIAVIGIAVAGISFFRSGTAVAKNRFPVTKTDAQWRRILPRSAYNVLRKSATERPYSSPLDKEKRRGRFVCKGCGQHLYSSSTKYDSRTGWPSFYRPIRGGIRTKTDYKIGYPRTEVHCARCGGHLGHVFNDGPKPTGKRYCMNGAAMKFIAG